MGAVIYHGMSINNGSMRQVQRRREDLIWQTEDKEKVPGRNHQGQENSSGESAGKENKILGPEVGPPDEAATAGGGGCHSDIVYYVGNLGSFLGMMGTMEACNSNATRVLCIS